MKIGLHILGLLVVASIQGIAQESKYQDPEPPFPYASEEVSFTNESDEIALSGTLTYPKEKGPHPAVILISGSGPQDRNSELLGHRPFLVISDYLTRNGIAVLRTDDRGAGESGGDHNASGLAKFTSDARTAVDYLKSRSEINSSKIGLVGHSLGGIIGPMTAADNSDIAYLILLAGPGMKGHELMLLQKEIIERQMGIDDLSIAIGQKNIGGAYDIILSAKMDSDSLNTQLKAYFKQIYGLALTEEQLSATAEQLSFPWFTDFVRYNPDSLLNRVNCPVLAINGSNDVQVPAEKNLAGIKSALESGGNKTVETLEMDGLNHLFQHSESGLPQEYGKIEETFSEEVLEIMTV